MSTNFTPIFRTFALIIAATALFLSCQDDDDNGNNIDKDVPEVMLISPIDNSVFDSRQNIDVQISLVDDSKIVSYKILVRNTLNNELEFIRSEFNSTKTVDFVEELNFEVVEDTPMDIEVEARDSEDNIFSGKIGSFEVKRLSGGILDLAFNMTYDGEPFQLFKNYIYPSGESISFSRLSFYLSDVQLSRGSQVSELLEVDYVNMTSFLQSPPPSSSIFSYKINAPEFGEFEKIEFAIGLPPTTNQGKPSDYSVTHPLGFSSEHWSGWSSYVFFKLEGKFDADNNGAQETDISIHLGADDAYRSFSMDENFSIIDNETSTIQLNFDVRQIFISEDDDIYDLKKDPRIHDLEQLNEIITLSDNLKNAILKN